MIERIQKYLLDHELTLKKRIVLDEDYNNDETIKEITDIKNIISTLEKLKGLITNE